MSSTQAHAPKGAVSVKAVIAVFAAGVLAGVIAVLPLILPDPEPSQDHQVVAAASTDGRAPSEAPPAAEPAADPCAGQTWPYLDSACADSKAKEQDTRQVRVISTDRAAPSTLATRTPRLEPKPVRPAPVAPAPVVAATPAVPAPAEPVPAAQPVEPPAATAQTLDNPPLPRPAPARPAEPPAAEPSVPVQTVAAPASEPAAEPQPARAAEKPASEPSKPVISVRKVALPDAEPEQSEAAPPKSKVVTVRSSKKAKRSKPQPVEDREDRSAETPATRELARGRTRPVADPGRSLDGPTLVRTYQYPDGRRVTVYRRLDRGGDSQALAYGGERGGRRVMMVPLED